MYILNPRPNLFMNGGCKGHGHRWPCERISSPTPTSLPSCVWQCKMVKSSPVYLGRKKSDSHEFMRWHGQGSRYRWAMSSGGCPLRWWWGRVLPNVPHHRRWCCKCLHQTNMRVPHTQPRLRHGLSAVSMQCRGCHGNNQGKVWKGFANLLASGYK